MEWSVRRSVWRGCSVKPSGTLAVVEVQAVFNTWLPRSFDTPRAWPVRRGAAQRRVLRKHSPGGPDEPQSCFWEAAARKSRQCGGGPCCNSHLGSSRAHSLKARLAAWYSSEGIELSEAGSWEDAFRGDSGSLSSLPGVLGIESEASSGILIPSFLFCLFRPCH